MNTSKSTKSKSKIAVIGAAVLVLSGIATTAQAEIHVWSKWGGLRWCSYNTETNEGSCWWASPTADSSSPSRDVRRPVEALVDPFQDAEARKAVPQAAQDAYYKARAAKGQALRGKAVTASTAIPNSVVEDSNGKGCTDRGVKGPRTCTGLGGPR